MELVKQVWLYVKQEPLRFLLCSLSMAVAVTSLCVISYFSHIVTSTVLEQVSLMGADLLLGYVEDDRGLLDDWMASMQGYGDLKCYSLVAMDSVTIDDTVYDLKFVNADYALLQQMEIQAGRWLNDWDSAFLHRVVVVGNEVPLMVGDAFLYKHEWYTVIGKLQMTNESFYGNDNTCIFMPYAFCEEPLIQQVMMLTSNEMHTKKYFEEYVGMFVDASKIEVFSQSQMKEAMETLMHILEQVLYWIVCISFLVSMIGIGNVMLISVEERKQEIGIRKALGASWLDLLFGFFLEIACISVVGYVLGIVCGLFLILVIMLVMDTAFYVDMGLCGMLFIVCLGVGTFAGMVPAIMASRKDIVEVLKE